MMSDLKCPKCSSNDTDSHWTDSYIGEYQAAECYECGLEWNECARDYWQEGDE